MTIKQMLPTQIAANGKQYGEGYCTPTCMDTEQHCYFCPQRVIPVIFLPGIMGSNLRMSAERQQRLNKKNNVAWRPDDAKESLHFGTLSPRDRQLQLDPEATVVDVYDPKTDPTGDADETADQRHGNVGVHIMTARTPLMMADSTTATRHKSAIRKAKERGWGEVFFGSYGPMLNHLETCLNLAFQDGKLNPQWKDVVGVDPKRWGEEGKSKLKPLTEQDLKQVLSDCFYPVHAFGYNWLQCNGDSAELLAERVKALIADYVNKGFRCEKVILVTHSLGGLVARALCHSGYGDLHEQIAGIVHGQMPAIGSAAGYGRMRAGFEGGTVADKVIGNEGAEVTAVLANAPGGLQLLPSEAYGDGWLRLVSRSGKLLKSLPEKGDPYSEIYAKAGVWWGLLREEWINPAGAKDAGLDQTKKYLKKAKEFHRDINGTYHDITYSHYGCDPRDLSFQNVTWELSDDSPFDKLGAMHVVSDSQRGQLRLEERLSLSRNEGNALPKTMAEAKGEVKGRFNFVQPVHCTARLRPPSEVGDGTVPTHSADHQLLSGKVSGIFRQAGYGHQESYLDENVLAATLYSIVRIAQKMAWKDGT